MAVNKVVYGTEVLVDLTADTVSADKLVEGITAHDKSGVVIQGTLIDGDELGYGDPTLPLVNVAQLDFEISDSNETEPEIGMAQVGFAVLGE